MSASRTCSTVCLPAFVLGNSAGPARPRPCSIGPRQGWYRRPGPARIPRSGARRRPPHGRSLRGRCASGIVAAEGAKPAQGDAQDARPPDPERDVGGGDGEQHPQGAALARERDRQRGGIEQAGEGPGALLGLPPHRSLHVDQPALEHQDAGGELQPGPAGVEVGAVERHRQQAGHQASGRGTAGRSRWRRPPSPPGSPRSRRGRPAPARGSA